MIILLNIEHFKIKFEKKSHKMYKKKKQIKKKNKKIIHKIIVLWTKIIQFEQLNNEK